MHILNATTMFTRAIFELKPVNSQLRKKVCMPRHPPPYYDTGAPPTLEKKWICHVTPFYSFSNSLPHLGRKMDPARTALFSNETGGGAGRWRWRRGLVPGARTFETTFYIQRRNNILHSPSKQHFTFNVETTLQPPPLYSF